MRRQSPYTIKLMTSFWYKCYKGGETVAFSGNHVFTSWTAYEVRQVHSHEITRLSLLAKLLEVYLGQSCRQVLHPLHMVILKESSSISLERGQTESPAQ